MRTSDPGNRQGLLKRQGFLERHSQARGGGTTAAQCAPRQRQSLPLQPSRGFTLLELLLVVAVLAVSSAMVMFALRDGEEDQVQREAERLALLLEQARTEARASGLEVYWLPGPLPSDSGALGPVAGSSSAPEGAGFRFVGLPAALTPPGRWLQPRTQAWVAGGSAVRLGPEPVIAPQRIELRVGGGQRVLATDGIAPFAVVPRDQPPG